MCRCSLLGIAAAFTAFTLGASVAHAQHPLPAPWQHTDIGDVGLAGNATQGSDGDLFISGAGHDIWGTADSFHFMYQTIYDGEIRTNGGFRLSDSPGTLDPHAKLGLMIRATLDPDSPHIILDIQPDGSIEFMQRSVAGGETTFLAGFGATDFGWSLKLVRGNGVITGIACGGPSRACQTVGTAPFPDGPALIGVAITSHDPGILAHGYNAADLPGVQTVPNPWSRGDVGAVGIRGSAYYQSSTQTFTVNGAGADIWGTSDSYQLVANFMKGDGSIVARVTSEDAANTFAKAGLVVTANGNWQANVILDIRPNGGIEFMSRPSSGAQMSFVAGSASSFPVWLKLQRTGNTFTGYTSTDGTQWDVVGSTDVSMPNSIAVGLAVTSHDVTVLDTAIFDHVVVASDQFQDIDVGDTGAVGSVTTDDVSCAVHGAGADIWGTQDAFHYMYVSQVNDATFYARVDSLDNTSAFAKAGIMIRASTDPSAAHVIVDVKPDGGIEFMARSINGGETQYIAGVAHSFPAVLELRRVGSTVTAYVIDNNHEMQIGSIDIDLPPEALIGLAVSSHERGTLATGTFSGISR